MQLKFAKLIGAVAFTLPVLWASAGQAIETKECPIQAQQVKNTYSCPRCNLSGANFQNRNLPSADLREANLTGASLRGSYLVGANFRGANLAGADLRGANVSGADFSSTVLCGTVLPSGQVSNRNCGG